MPIERLFIAEKDSVAVEIAKFLGKSAKASPVRQGGYIQVGQDAVVAMRGHLLRKADAAAYDPRYATWSLSNLPIIPNPFKLEIDDSRDGYAKRAVATISKLLRECSLVVGCGDQDAEGQLIQDELLNYLGNRKPVLRLWTNALDDKSLAAAFADLKPNEHYRGWYESALCRSDADWLLGINATIAFTLHAQACGYAGTVNLGRVQTPTLSLTVARELAIRSFVKKTYYTPTLVGAISPALKAKWQPHTNVEGKVEDPRVDAEGYLTSKPTAQEIVDAVSRAGFATVVKVENTAGTEAAPLPFSLTALQTHCSKLFGYTAKQTLDIAQRLYLRKLLSYPRVDTRHLKEEHFDSAAAVLRSHLSGPLPDDVRAAIDRCRFTLKSKAWDNSKCTAHYAISPVHVDDPASLQGLEGPDLLVYLEVLKRFALQFWPVAKFARSKISLRAGVQGREDSFVATGKVYTDLGWMAAFKVTEDDAGAKDDADEAQVLPKVDEGQRIPIASVALATGETKPPKRYTDGTLAEAMENIYLHVTNPEYRRRLQAKGGAGIGTSATRGPMIETMVKRGFLTRDSKTHELIPSEASMQLMQILPASLRAPDMTAMWQMLTDEVREQRATYDAFMGKIIPWVGQVVASAASTFKPGQFGNASSGKTAESCFGNEGRPGCGSPLRLVNGVQGKYRTFFACTNKACGKTFNESKGKPVERVQAPPPQPGSPEAKVYGCPKCQQGQLRRTPTKAGGYFWGCSNFKSGCKAGFNDVDGAPELEPKLDTTYKCTKCGNGYMQKRARKSPQTGFFWGCSAWKEGCKHIVDDKDDKPDLYGRKSFTATGRPRLETPRFGSAARASDPDDGTH